MEKEGVGEGGEERGRKKKARRIHRIESINENSTLPPLSPPPFSSFQGPRMVRDVFRLARENAPAIVFIDEVDAIATARFDAQTGADREVQRILMELLAQMDGFDQSVNVKVIMATNRADTLDPALLRPGRLDRKIEFPLPDRRQKRLVFSACTSKMNLADDVDLEDYVSRPDKVSNADIAAICQEAGMQAVRKNRYVVLAKDFEVAYRKTCRKPGDEFEFYS